jgi:crotonobetainyl-CoA:carnitine CoA-transferase CaiB-like acyl-CoA transferase
MLDGIKVIEIGQVMSAPFGGSILADLGAQVIKIERPEVGDDARRMGPALLGDVSNTFHIANRGKRSIALDLKAERDRSALMKLLSGADVLLHNMRPGSAERLGLGGPELCKQFPRLIYCSVSGFGNAGPQQFEPAFEPIVQAASGLFSINGDPDTAPGRIGPSVVDMGSGMWAVIGILTAIIARSTSGKGGVVETSLFETALTWGIVHVSNFLNAHKEEKRLKDSAHPNLVPYQAFAASDGHLVIAAGNDRLFARLCKVLGREDWIEDPNFRGNRDRLRNRELLVSQIAKLVAQKPRDEWLAVLKENAIPCTPIRTIREAVESDQIRALGMIQEVQPAGIKLLGLPLSFDGVRPQIKSSAPNLGEAQDLLDR